MDKKYQSGMLCRRRFLQAGALAAGALIIPGQAMAEDGPIKLPALPYAKNALEPYISQKTVEFHYGKHHAGYVKNTNRLISGTKYAQMSLLEIIKTSARLKGVKLFNNAAQVFNHNLYWESMKPGGGGKPEGDLAAKINRAFGSYDKFREEFTSAATGRFGSGYAWLITINGNLTIISTPNADTALGEGAKPLLTLDVWEHAYYLDYQNRRLEYINTWFDHLLNWDCVAKNLKG